MLGTGRRAYDALRPDGCCCRCGMTHSTYIYLILHTTYYILRTTYCRCGMTQEEHRPLRGTLQKVRVRSTTRGPCENGEP